MTAIAEFDGNVYPLLYLVIVVSEFLKVFIIFSHKKIIGEF